MLSSKLSIVSTASLFGLGGVILTLAYHKRISLLLWRIRNKRIIQRDKKVFIISNHQQWKQIEDVFCKATRAVNAVGFDCEWIQVDGRKRPVALLQLATYEGVCALVRLNILKDRIPQSLREILANENIAKVGVSADIDRNYLVQDYNIKVNGWVDLRHLAVRHSQAASGGGDGEEKKLGLEALTGRYLGRAMNKDWRVRMGDWEAPIMANIQVDYAAEDALVGIQILLCLLTDLWGGASLSSSSSWLWPPLGMGAWQRMTLEAVREVCSPVREVKFAQRSGADGSWGSKGRDVTGPSPAKPLKDLRMSYSIRKSPLYHNSQLWAPDGEPLCTCDPKKAIWYVEKGLGQLVSESPLIVKLKFEPAGRPNKEGVDGQFYLQERLNLCVVCGKEESYIRKNVIPHEYRKHFPQILKSHQSHDVLLLCTECHQLSNIKDNALRYSLAREFDAPIGCETDVKETMDGRLKAVRSAAGALKKSRDRLPPARIRYLEEVLKSFYGVEVLSQEKILMAAELDTKIMNEDYVPHGYKVYLHYRRVGLIRLEQRWRQWFLDTMSPRFMPEKWSICHNHKKLRIKMARYPLDDPVRMDYKMALVGEEGEIEVPYVPKEKQNGRAFDDPNSDEDFSRESSPEETPGDLLA